MANQTDVIVTWATMMAKSNAALAAAMKNPVRPVSGLGSYVMKCFEHAGMKRSGGVIACGSDAELVSVCIHYLTEKAEPKPGDVPLTVENGSVPSSSAPKATTKPAPAAPAKATAKAAPAPAKPAGRAPKKGAPAIKMPAPAKQDDDFDVDFF